MLVSGVIAGLVVGFAARRSLRPLARLRPRLPALLVFALFIRALASIPYSPELQELQRVLYVVSLVGLTAALLANVSLPGASAMAAGIASNALVVSGNGGAMPVSAEAAALVGRGSTFDALHAPMSSNTFMPILADVIPIPIFAGVYSIGDTLLAAGAFMLTVRTMARGS